jgi:hypothetical protein
MAEKIQVYLELGEKRTFAGAIEWPGWCRGGRDEISALQALLECAPRYSKAIAPAGINVPLPTGFSTFEVIERLTGNATTDFGAPAIPPAYDAAPLDRAEMDRLQVLLAACWQALDRDSQSAMEKELRKGPRGGGRERAEIVDHLLESAGNYIGAFGVKVSQEYSPDQSVRARQVQQAVVDALEQSLRGEIPPTGPRGKVYWTPRYFVRRTAWHILDHAWEIEDRIL